MGQIKGHGEEHHVVLAYLFPVLVRVDLLPIADVPKEDYDGGNDRDDSPNPLVVPFHIVQEKADPLAITRMVVLTV